MRPCVLICETFLKELESVFKEENIDAKILAFEHTCKKCKDAPDKISGLMDDIGSREVVSIFYGSCIRPDYREYPKNFFFHDISSFIDCQSGAVIVGMDHFRDKVLRALTEDKSVVTETELKKKLGEANKKVADYGVALDLASKAGNMSSEHDIIQHILDTFNVLFAPRLSLYWPVNGIALEMPHVFPPGSDLGGYKAFGLFEEREREREEDDNELFFEIKNDEETFGLVHLEEIAFPQYKKMYKNLGIFLTNTFSLSISNIRMKQAEKIQEYRTSTRILESYYKSDGINEVINTVVDIILSNKDIDGVLFKLGSGDEFDHQADRGHVEHFFKELKVQTEDTSSKILGYCSEGILFRANPEKSGECNQRGSFWSSDLEQYFLDIQDERNESPNIGLTRSLALIPLRSYTSIVGILFLASNKKEFFTEDVISYYESLSSSITAIIERIKIDEQIKESEARFKSLYYDSPISLWEEDFSEVKKILDQKTGRNPGKVMQILENDDKLLYECVDAVKIVDVNDTSMEIYGTSDKSKLLQGLRTIVMDKSNELLRNQIVSLYDPENFFEGEVLHNTIDDRSIWVYLSMSMPPGYEDTWEKVFVSIIDITERKMAQEEVVENQRYLRHVLDSQPNIVVISDGKFLIDTNKAFFDFFDQFRDLDDFRSEHDCISDLFENAMEDNYLLRDKEGKSWISILRENGDVMYKVLILKNGKECRFAVNLVTTTVFGKCRNIVTFTEITVLEERVKEETTKRTEMESLLFQQAGLTKMGEVLTMMAHHWRQPLFAVCLELQNIQDSFEMEELDGETLNTTVDKMLNILGALSGDLSNISSVMSKKSQEDSSFDLKELTKQVVDLFDGEFNESKIACELSFDDGPLNLRGVPAFFNQIVTELLKNAEEELVTLDESQREIKISLKKADKGAVILSIWNRGSKINSEVAVRMFEPFYTTKDITIKTGLGLYSVKMLVEQKFNGHIHVSNKNEGVEFLVEFMTGSDQ